MNNTVGIGIIGSQFISSIHVEALKSVTDAQIIAVMSPTKGNAEKFAKKHGIPHFYDVIDDLLSREDIHMVIVGAPNKFHCEITLKAAKAKKHIVVEKPLCMNLAEADLMIKTCKEANVKLM
jgi:predicted dehydrogenase